MRDEAAEGEVELTYPIRGIFVGCAPTAPHNASAKAITESPADFRPRRRFWSAGPLLALRLSEKESSHRTQVLLFILFVPQSKIENVI
jgi:hypothetical protein